MADGPTGRDGRLHLVKLCVGADSLADLAAWQASRAAQARPGRDPRPVHVTRMWPRRASELLDGGSLYWVVRGAICVRQRIAELLETRGEDGIRRCAIVLDPGLVRVEARVRKPFQGWRYLEGRDAPRDLGGGTGPGSDDEDLPADLCAALAEFGLLDRAR